ncbi:hypothetical protein OAP22_04535 [Candidatus Pelagibacter ubique]|nr:hypothetical protein [Candidatus Pelagibacter ubique]
MNNLKKIGLSALAGSLVAFSASAVEMSVSGVAEVTYSTVEGTGADQISAGNPWGSNTSLKFSGSGDVGFGTATIVRTLNDTGASYLSAYQTLDMGSLGTLSFDSGGTGLEGVGAYDDVLPTAYEEVWNGVAASEITGAKSNDTLGYSNSFGPIGVSLAYSGGGTAMSSDGTVAAEAGTGKVKDMHFTIDGSMLVDGLTLMAGTATTETPTTGTTDTTENVAHIVYSSGPVSLGYRLAESQPGSFNTTQTGLNIDAYSIAFAVNENLSISLAQQDTEFDKTGTAAVNVTNEVTALNAAYTVGAATVRGTMSESDNDEGVTGATEDFMEISLVLSF